MSSRRRRVVLGVTGSIAAYKSAEIVRGLAKAGCEVRCVLTRAAKHFVAPLALATLSNNPVLEDMHDPSLWKMAHLGLADWADLVLIAPATADFIARLAHGRAAELLDGLVLSRAGNTAVCPAMDEQMWRHPATQGNVARLREYGYKIWGPEKGELASGKTGWGRLLAVNQIIKLALKK